MQVKPISAPPVSVSASTGTAGTYKPFRLNFAQVCMYCGTRWCESLACVEMHAGSLWAPCPDCDGFGTTIDCFKCSHGVVEVDEAGIAELSDRVLPVEHPDITGPRWLLAADATG
jgi:hypothetical protein